jgi:sigma-B regulation protein RsbU (phosphoserine phosphatase)
MSLRTKLILLVVGMAVVIVTATLLLVNRRVTLDFTSRAESDVLSARDTLAQSLRESLDAYRVQGQIIADATLLKEALIRRSPELAFAYADSARDTASIRYLVVLDANGVIVADAKNELPRGSALASGLDRAPRAPKAQVGFLRLRGGLVAAAVVPVLMDQQLLGYVMLGDVVTPKRLGIAQRVARSDITLLGLRGERVVSTLPDESAAAVAAQWLAHRQGSATARATEAITLDEIPHLLASEALTGLGGAALGTVVVTRSLQDQRRALGDLQRWLVGLGAIFALFAVAAGALLGHRLAAPVRALTAAAEKIARGEVDALPAVSAELESGPSPAAPLPKSDNEIETLSRAFQFMASAVAERQERLKREMELAQRLQTAILPRRLTVPALDVSAVMIPATEVGGDYYDVLPAGDGCWLGIGDVAGHGLNAGLTMLMIQSMVAALVRQHPRAAPSELVAVLNDALCDNLRERLGRREHATLSLLKYDRSGRVWFAGAHEEMLVYRAATGEVEAIPTTGIWVGIRRDIAGVTRDATFTLAEGDVLLLYTDGTIEGRNAAGELLGIERLRAALAEAHAEPVDVIRDQLAKLVREWTRRQDDDVTVLVARYVGGAAA